MKIITALPPATQTAMPSTVSHADVATQLPAHTKGNILKQIFTSAVVTAGGWEVDWVVGKAVEMVAGKAVEVAVETAVVTQLGADWVAAGAAAGWEATAAEKVAGAHTRKRWRWWIQLRHHG